MAIFQEWTKRRGGKVPQGLMDTPNPGTKLLEGLNVLVTGACRNIGRAIALEMAAAGARIFFTDIDEEGIKRLEDELKGRNAEARGFLSDISSTTDSDRLVTFFAEKRIPLHVLVNNAAMARGHGDARNMQPDQWRALFDTNLLGPMYLTSRVAGMMIDQEITGSIIFITSTHDHVVSRWPDYSASKAAVTMAVKELAIEFAGHGIRVNAIAPGFVWLNAQGEPLPHPYTPLGRQTIHPAYIGRAAVCLSSDYFSHCTTGSVLVVDGGLSLYNHRVLQEPPRTGTVETSARTAIGVVRTVRLFVSLCSRVVRLVKRTLGTA
jgi:NAD(P)-dependent dehydrogenase (short-subunit alcohol dehydrogenase family)